ncbi:hypothetical protein LSH36_40g08004 [Paralvinella palmiformis]|uniref:Dynamin N-terminal domain-containing protein n=1 Tax=Paralvinella palmiformis TaxID=53620 RepID=A0AAD9K744_9ANNE|nr:hypothetical protein LSH36_40g08004 [Paralvinella palmiformis]
MSGKVRQRGAANPADSATLSANEKILKECHSLYTDPDNGLVEIARGLGLQLLAPRKKITILLIGNHSAGKSSFINWYVEEHVQKTGVAIETQGFTLVTSGRKRESLKGNATLHLYPHFEPLRQIPGVVDYMTTEISTSKQKKFSLVTFVDTPGLVDGDMKYLFDVDRAILWLVLMQIVQELCKRPGLNRTGFDMPTIFVPTLSSKQGRCVNQIEEVCKDIEKTINHTIQNTLNSLEKDCEQIAQLVDEKLQRDRENGSYNFRARAKGGLFCLLGVLLPALLAINFLISTTSRQVLETLLGNHVATTLKIYLGPIQTIWSVVPRIYHLYVWISLLVLMLFLLLLAKMSARKQKRALVENRNYVKEYVIKKKQQLYAEYLQQSVAEYDM